MTINYTANTDFNSDGEFSECELDTSWATLQVKKLLETSTSSTIEIGGQSFYVYDDSTFLNAVKAMIALNVSASIASDGCAVTDSLPVSITVADTVYPFENAVGYWRLNDPYENELSNLSPAKSTSFYNSVTGVRDTSSSGYSAWSHWKKDSRWEQFLEMAGVMTLPVGSDLGNGEWTLHFRYKPFNDKPQGANVINKSDILKVDMWGGSIYVTAGSKQFQAEYPSGGRPDGSSWVYFTLVHTDIGSNGTNLRLYMNGEDVGNKNYWSTPLFSTGESGDLAIKMAGEIKDIFVCASATTPANVLKMATRPIPFIPKFYSNFMKPSWLGDRHGVTFRGIELETTLNWGDTKEWDSPIEEKTDATDSGPNPKTTRKAFRCGRPVGTIGRYSAKLTDIVDMSKSFTISTWIMVNSDWVGDAISIADKGGNKLSIGIAGGAEQALFISHTASRMSRVDGFSGGGILTDNFQMDHWHHLVIVKNEGHMAFYLNGLYPNTWGGSYVEVSNSVIGNQGVSDITFGTSTAGLWISDLFVIDGPITSPHTWKSPSSNPEVAALFNGTYFYE